MTPQLTLGGNTIFQDEPVGVFLENSEKPIIITVTEETLKNIREIENEIKEGLPEGGSFAVSIARTPEEIKEGRAVIEYGNGTKGDVFIAGASRVEFQSKREKRA